MSSEGEDPAAGWTGPEFEELFVESRRYIFRFCAAHVGRVNADDVTAEVFAEAWRVRRRFDPTLGSPRSWLFGIAHNIVRKHHRRDAARKRAYSRVDVVEPNTLDEDGIVERTDARASVDLVMGRLDEIDQSIVLMLAYGELTFDEASVALGMPVGTIKSRVSRARARLSHSSTRWGEGGSG